MIPITPEIIGPGIEEDYQDALERIEKLLEIVPDSANNETPGGRFRYELLWLRQEIMAGRLPLPVERGWVASIRAVFAEAWLSKLPGCDRLCSELLTVLDYGLVKPRHYPVVASMIEDAAQKLQERVTLGNRPSRLVEAAGRELGEIRTFLIQKVASLPLRSEDWPAIKALLVSREELPYSEAGKSLAYLDFVLFIGVRPKECSKGPLAPPNSEPLRRLPRPVQSGA